MSSAPVAMLINGQPGDLIAAADRAVQYGDGLFETVRCERGAPRWFERHVARLRRGCERLHLPQPDEALLAREVSELAAGEARVLVKIIYTRGPGAARGYAPRDCLRPTRIVSRHPWPQRPAHWHSGFRVGFATQQLGENPALAGIKHLNRLEQVLAALEAEALEVDEVLLATQSDQLIGGAMSNLFLIEAGSLLTPPLERCGVAGIMRSLVIDTAPQVGLAVSIAPVSTARVAAAASVFLTNVRLGLQCVHWLAGRALAPDPRISRLQELLDVCS
jgi:4-amino-4-deoxychorismate lyase